MALKWIVLIGVIAIWIVMLLVLGFLALTYQNQHTPLIEKRKQYYQNWNQIKSEIDLDQIFLNPLKINFELPSLEQVYYLDIDNPVYLYSKTTKEYKTLLKFEGKKPTIYENYFDDLDIMSLRSGYKLNKIKVKNPSYTGTIYISNFRVIINDLNTKKSHQIPLAKIQKAYISMIQDRKAYSQGYIIQTEDELYEIVSDQPIAVLIINQLLRKKAINEDGKLRQN